MVRKLWPFRCSDVIAGILAIIRPKKTKTPNREINFIKSLNY